MVGDLSDRMLVALVSLEATEVGCVLIDARVSVESRSGTCLFGDSILRDLSDCVIGAISFLGGFGGISSAEMRSVLAFEQYLTGVDEKVEWPQPRKMYNR